MSLINQEGKVRLFPCRNDENFNDPKKFWKSFKSATEQAPLSDFPNFDWEKCKMVSDKLAILNYFIEHFISVGSLFDDLNPCSQNVYTDGLFLKNECNSTTFNFSPICTDEVLRDF